MGNKFPLSVRVLMLAIVCPTASIEAKEAKTPDTVVVGTYVNQIYGVDLKNNSFNVDFYVWFRWSNDAIKPMETFELVNGKINSRSAVASGKAGNMNLASARIHATITKFWDMSRFPLDRHELTIEVEDGDQDSDGIVYEADTSHAALSDDVQVPGWLITSSSPKVTGHEYKARRLSSAPAGLAAVPRPGAARYSRYVFSTFIERPGYGRFIKAFLGLFVSVLVAYLAFFVRPKDLSPRVSLGVGAIFAVAAASFTINNMLPESATLTMADQLIMAALTCVALSVLGTIWSVQLTYRGLNAESVRFDRICAWVLPVVYTGLLGYVVGFSGRV